MTQFCGRTLAAGSKLAPTRIAKPAYLEHLPAVPVGRQERSPEPDSPRR